jgi:hypothetical protein
MAEEITANGYQLVSTAGTRIYCSFHSLRVCTIAEGDCGSVIFVNKQDKGCQSQGNPHSFHAFDTIHRTVVILVSAASSDDAAHKEMLLWLGEVFEVG